MDDVWQTIDKSNLDKLVLKKEINELKDKVKNLNHVIDEYRKDDDNSVEAIDDIKSLIDGIINLINAKKEENIDISKLRRTFSMTPKIGEEVRVSIVSKTNLNLTWEVKEEPLDGNIIIYSNSNTINITPEKAGKYTIVAKSSINSSEKEITFYIHEEIPFDMEKLKTVGDNKDLDTAIGYVENQIMVDSNNTDKEYIKNLVNEYYNDFIYKGYSFIHGHVFEFDNNKYQFSEIKEILTSLQEIDYVILRPYAGIYSAQLSEVPNDAYKTIPPITYPITKVEDLEKWHLLDINLYKAWNETKGNDNIPIVICDGGYQMDLDQDGVSIKDGLTIHRDIQKVGDIMSDSTDVFKNINHAFYDTEEGKIYKKAHPTLKVTHSVQHGMQTVGIISGTSNNAIGISGINWNSKFIIGQRNICLNETDSLDDKYKLINNSWGWTYYKDFNVNSRDYIALTKAVAGDRKLIRDNSKRLYIFAAGNGFVDARYDAGILHYESDNRTISKLSNLIIVGAYTTQNLYNKKYPKKKTDEKYKFIYNDGDSIDILAPTLIGTTEHRNGFIVAHGGTSAATPVVTGVASLIYSINKDFTPQQVKGFLLDGAKNGGRKLKMDDGREVYILNAYQSLLLAKDASDNMPTKEDNTQPTQEPTPEPISLNCFNDVSSNTNYAEHICNLKADKILSDNVNYRPTENISRAEFLKIALLGNENNQIGNLDNRIDDNNFVDIAEDTLSDKWYIPYINYAVANIIARGYDENGDGIYEVFGVYRNVTLMEAIKMTLLSFNITIEDKIDDETDNDWGRYIRTMTKTYPKIETIDKNTFENITENEKNKPITRAYMAYLVDSIRNYSTLNRKTSTLYNSPTSQVASLNPSDDISFVTIHSDPSKGKVIEQLTTNKGIYQKGDEIVITYNPINLGSSNMMSVSLKRDSYTNTNIESPEYVRLSINSANSGRLVFTIPDHTAIGDDFRIYVKDNESGVYSVSDTISIVEKSILPSSLNIEASITGVKDLFRGQYMELKPTIAENDISKNVEMKMTRKGDGQVYNLMNQTNVTNPTTAWSNGVYVTAKDDLVAGDYTIRLTITDANNPDSVKIVEEMFRIHSDTTKPSAKIGAIEFYNYGMRFPKMEAFDNASINDVTLILKNLSKNTQQEIRKWSDHRSDTWSYSGTSVSGNNLVIGDSYRAVLLVTDYYGNERENTMDFVVPNSIREPIAQIHDLKESIEKGSRDTTYVVLEGADTDLATMEFKVVKSGETTPIYDESWTNITSSNPKYGVRIPILNASEGEYICTLTVTDKMGYSTTDKQSFTITPDTTIDTIKPTTSVSGINAEYIRDDIVSITMRANDNIQLSTVTLQVAPSNNINNRVVNMSWYPTGSSFAKGYELDTSNLLTGEYQYSLFAKDSSGNEALVSHGSFRVNSSVTETEKPTGSVSGFFENYLKGNIIYLKLRGYDNEQLSKVTLHVAKSTDINNKLVNQSWDVDSWSFSQDYSIDTSSYSAGKYEYSLFVKDINDNFIDVSGSFIINDGAVASLETTIDRLSLSRLQEGQTNIPLKIYGQNMDQVTKVFIGGVINMEYHDTINFYKTKDYVSVVIPKVYGSDVNVPFGDRTVILATNNGKIEQSNLLYVEE